MLAPDRIVRMKTVLARTGLSRSTIYRKIAEGTFPARFKISVNGAGWRESDIDRWIADPAGWRATNEMVDEETEWTRAARSSEIVVQLVVVGLGGTLLRVGDEVFCGFALHPSVEHISPALKHDLPLGEVAVHVVDGRDPIPRRVSQAHLDPAIIELGAI